MFHYRREKGELKCFLRQQFWVFIRDSQPFRILTAMPKNYQCHLYNLKTYEGKVEWTVWRECEIPNYPFNGSGKIVETVYCGHSKRFQRNEHNTIFIYHFSVWAPGTSGPMVSLCSCTFAHFVLPDEISTLFMQKTCYDHNLQI